MLRGHQKEDNLLSDYCDGSIYKSHPLFSTSGSISLEILAYYDDAEVCNPLGSRAKKHKLGKDMHVHVHIHLCVYNNLTFNDRVVISFHYLILFFSTVLLHAR